MAHIYFITSSSYVYYELKFIYTSKSLPFETAGIQTNLFSDEIINIKDA